MDKGFEPLAYAIDFGTTNSLLAAANRDAVHAPIALDPFARDPSILRSVLYFPDASRCFYGAQALHEYATTGPQGRLIRSIKKHLPSRSFVGTYIDERPMNLEDLIGAMLGEMRARANRFFGADVTRAVMGRPARFSRDDADDRFAEYRLERAARIAGFTQIDFLPEPIAAAREFRSTLEGEKRVLVADFGGGTSDFTVLRMRRERYDSSDVLAIGGVSVAGDAFDASLMRHHVSRHFGAEVTYRVPFGSNVLRMPPALMEKICAPAEASLLRKQDAQAFLRDVRAWSLGPEDEQHVDQLLIFVEDNLGFPVFEAIEAGKRVLSDAESTCIRYDYPGIEVDQPVTRAQFDAGSARQTEAILQTLDTTLADAGTPPEAVDIVCCTGGTARLPALEAALAQRFGRDKLAQFQHFHSVVHGLADHARALLAE